MVRAIAATLVGLVVAVALGFVIGLISHKIWPPPPDLSDMPNYEAMHNAIASMPVGALASVAIVWVAGAFGGGLVAANLSGRRTPAYVVGGVMALSSVTDLLMILHPFWIWKGAIVLVPLAAFLAARLGAPRNAATSNA